MKKLFGLVLLLALVGGAGLAGWKAGLLPDLRRGEVRLDVVYDPQLIPASDPAAGDYAGVLRLSLRVAFPVLDPAAQAELLALLDPAAAAQLRRAVQRQPELIGRTEVRWLPASTAVSAYLKGQPLPQGLSARQASWLVVLQSAGGTRLVWPFMPQ